MTHPQIAAFAREAKENEPPVRTIEGQKTLLSRTMHGFSYDPIHDEIVVNSPLTQAILTFRGSVNGEEAPIRVIQGPKTRILGMGYAALSTVTADPEHNEIFLLSAQADIEPLETADRKAFSYSTGWRTETWRQNEF